MSEKSQQADMIYTNDFSVFFITVCVFFSLSVLVLVPQNKNLFIFNDNSSHNLKEIAVTNIKLNIVFHRHDH